MANIFEQYLASSEDPTPAPGPPGDFVARARALAAHITGQPDGQQLLDTLATLTSPTLPARRADDVAIAMKEATHALQAYAADPTASMARPLLIRARNAIERAAQHASI